MINDKEFPDIYLDASNNNPCISSPNCPYAIFFYQTRETLNGDVELFKRFIENSISRFRNSRTYKGYKAHLYDIGMNRCQMLGNITSDMATLEMHHNGITIFDLAVLITNHILVTRGKISTFDLIHELKKVHRNNKVPLVMLCKTMHQMVHNDEEFFIPTDMTFGFWAELLNDYCYGITYGIAKKLYYWIKISLEHSNDENINADLIRIREHIKKWSDYNEYYLGNNRYSNSNGANVLNIPYRY